ncbi:hypothetical protein SeMB42_g01057 [Synchytrium endobioticum]|uniref:Uncharacterized protein n=1 Tax=Synchytrium endobioticum TaxID=286115 RepID=A0A507DNC2_9FUNG|nr:hypothetical protein SeMB42_g01057 [Synchytrium endobioticum]
MPTASQHECVAIADPLPDEGYAVLRTGPGSASAGSLRLRNGSQASLVRRASRPASLRSTHTVDAGASSVLALLRKSLSQDQPLNPPPASASVYALMSISAHSAPHLASSSSSLKRVGSQRNPLSSQQSIASSFRKNREQSHA